MAPDNLPDKLIIYSENHTERLKYILNLIIKDMLGLDYTLTNELSVLLTWGGPAVNYSQAPVEGPLKIMPAGLLSETGLKQQELPSPSSWGDIPVFFRTEGADIPFDIFSASFFLVSRYEEYLPYKPDRHGRFTFSQSYTGKHGIHELPLVNIWANKLGEMLEERFPVLNIKPRKFDFLSTIDIDSATAFLHKPWYRSLASLFKSIMNREFAGFLLKARVLAGFEKDPFDAYSEWKEIHTGMAEKLILFFLVSSKSRFDMTINTGNHRWRKLVHELSEEFNCGIHPSYFSVIDARLIENEKRFLEDISSKQVVKSRQHFINLLLPGTYRALLCAGIREDYSMGFHDSAGYRAGIAHPFPFFDIVENRVTELMVYPFALMDRTLKDYMGLGTDAALKKTTGMIQTLRNTGGLFIPIWHNSSLSDYGEWKGWKNNYLRMIELCKSATL